MPHDITEFIEQIEILLRACQITDVFEDAVHLVGADTARNALAARFRHTEIHEIFRDVYHARGLVHHDHAAGTHDGACLDQRLIVDGHVEKLSRDASARGSSGLHRFESLVVGNSASYFVNDFAQRYSHGNFDHSGIDDISRQCEYLCPFALLGADRGIPLPAIADNGRYVCIGLNVINKGRRAIKSFLRRIRWSWARCPAFSLDRSDQCSLFATDKRSGAEPQVEMESEPRSADIIPQQPDSLGVPDCGSQTFDGQRVLGANVDISLGSSHRIGSDDHAFDHPVRIAFQYAAVHECTRIALVRVADHVFRRAACFGNSTPLEACRITGAATAPQSAFCNLLQDLGWRHLGQRSHESGVTICGYVLFNPFGIDYTGI